MHILVNLLLAIISYGSPVHYEIALAGNFGEPRPNHFHGGSDVKTGGVEGKPIFSIGDGYVSNVTIGIGGYGNAVYVHHPEGYTSVYCHLKKFSPQITAMVNKIRYERKRARGDFKFRPTDIPIARGQLIAVSGNTGSSQAPHLHLEIHETRTWKMMDPLEFIGSHVTDGLKPMGHAFMAYPVPGEGVFMGGSAKTNYNFISHNLTRKFVAWGKVGFGIWANDYMEITYNRYGVRKTELLVDGKPVFRSDVNGIPPTMNMMVNSWGDYEHFLRYNVWYMKSFVMPGNKLPILWADGNRGIVNFTEERDYHFTYRLTDFKGNLSEYTFTVTGKKAPIRVPATRHSLLNYISYSRCNNFQLPGMSLFVPSGQVEDDIYLSPAIKHQPGKLSDAYRLMSGSYPLFSYCKIALRLNRPVANPQKLYVVSHWGSDRYMGGQVTSTKQGIWVTGRARELGATYELAYDDQPPLIHPVSIGNELTVGLSDSGSGVDDYEAYVDGQFVLFDEVPKSPWVRCRLADTPVRKTGKIHRLVFKAWDNRRNTRTYTTTFKY